MEISSRSGALGAFAVDGILAKLTLFIAPGDAFEYAPANCECFDPLGVFEIGCLQHIHIPWSVATFSPGLPQRK